VANLQLLRAPCNQREAPRSGTFSTCGTPAEGSSSRGSPPSCSPSPSPRSRPTSPTCTAPNPRRCATGSCTPPPASSAGSAKSSSAWPSTGPGPWPSPEHCGTCGRSRSRPRSQHDGQHAPPPDGPRRHRTQRRSSALPSPEPTFRDHPQKSRSPRLKTRASAFHGRGLEATAGQGREPASQRQVVAAGGGQVRQPFWREQLG